MNPAFIFASDSLKGTISSRRAAELLQEAALSVFPDAECRAVEMADGGEGTVSAVLALGTGKVHEAKVTDPLGNPISASFGTINQSAIIEMAAASGLTLVPECQRNPLVTSSFGTGQLIRAALDAGCTDITIGIGGSATNDAGMGAMRALGARFFDNQENELMGCGAELGRVFRIDVSGLDSRLAAAGGSVHVDVICDVGNPLIGPEGAARVFAPQKGASPATVDELEAGMRAYARVMQNTFCPSFELSELPGGGAAGGLGIALVLFLDAQLRPGAQTLLELMGFDELLEGATLCITGEGRLDAQSTNGKAVQAVAEHCSNAGVPCIALVGSVARDVKAPKGITKVLPMDTDPNGSTLPQLEDAYRHAARNLFRSLAD